MIEILRFYFPYLQPSKWASHHFGRRLKTPGSETKNFITVGTAGAWASAYLPAPLASQILLRPCRGPTCRGFVSQLNTQGQLMFWASSKHYSKWQKTHSPSTGKHAVTWLSHSSGLGLLSCLCDKLEKLLSIRRRVSFPVWLAQQEYAGMLRALADCISQKLPLSSTQS